MTATEYSTITEADLTVAAFGVTLACAAGYASAGVPAASCSSAGEYTVTGPCTDINDCAGDPCGAAAAGSCADTGANSYECACSAGYTASGGGSTCTGVYILCVCYRTV